MVGAHTSTSCRPLFKELGLLTVPCLYLFILINITRLDIRNRTTNFQVHSHNNHRRNYMHAEEHNLSIFGRSPQYAGAAFYNTLAPDIKNVKCHTIMKIQQKTFLVASWFNSTYEFMLVWRMCHFIVVMLQVFHKTDEVLNRLYTTTKSCYISWTILVLN